MERYINKQNFDFNMATIDHAKTFFKEFIVLFGFFTGVWRAIGVNPEAEIFNALKIIIDTLNPGNGISLWFSVLPVLLFIITLIIIYFIARMWGIAAVSCGFIGGLLILLSPVLSIIFLLIGWILGYIGVSD